MFEYNGNRTDLKDAVNYLNDNFDKVFLTVNKNFIFLDSKQKYADYSLMDIFNDHKSIKEKTIIREYWYFSKRVMGYFKPSDPGYININTRSLPRSQSSIIGSIVHEYMHKVDSVSKNDYGHDDNYYKNWKGLTVPYYFGNFFSQVYAQKIGEIIPTYKQSFFRRILNIIYPF